jgi:hypothetical protein
VYSITMIYGDHDSSCQTAGKVTYCYIITTSIATTTNYYYHFAREKVISVVTIIIVVVPVIDVMFKCVCARVYLPRGSCFFKK